MANSLWSSLQYPTHKEFSEEISKKYKAEIASVDFSNPETTSRINKWVSEKTNKMIPKFLEQNLDESTVLVLLNAVYFKGLWEHKFTKEKTAKIDFHVANKEKKSIDFMNAFEKFFFVKGKSEDSSYNMMKYKDSNIGFVTYLPSKGDCPLDTADLE